MSAPGPQESAAAPAPATGSVVAASAWPLPSTTGPSDRAVAWTLGLLVTLAAAWLCEPGVGWLDSGEKIAAAAWGLGNSHPPGQPVHALLGKLLTFLPVGEIAFRVTLLSAIGLGAFAAGTYRLARTIVPEEAPSVRGMTGLAALWAALAPLSWTQAIRTEVYAPAAALCVWGLWLLAESGRRDDGRRWIVGAALVWGLVATLHPLVAAVLAAPALACVAFRERRRLLQLWAVWALGLGGLGLGVVAYLPLRAGAAHPPALRWGDPSTAARLWRVLTAQDYAQNFTTTGMGQRALSCVWLLAEGAGAGLLLLGGAGLAFGALTRLRGIAPLAVALAALVTATASVGLFYPDNPDVHGYLAPGCALLAVGTAALAAVVRRLWGAHAPWVLAAPLLVSLCLADALTVHAVFGGVSRDDEPPVLWAQGVGLAPAGPTIALVSSDHALFPALYERLVGESRPDVVLFASGLATSSWFLERVKAWCPELYVPFVDDGRAGNVSARFLGEARRRGVPIVAETGERGDTPLGRLYLRGVGTTGAPTPATAGADALETPAPAPLRFHAGLGARVAGHVALDRARFELGRGRRADAARALGVWDTFDDATRVALAAPEPQAPLLGSFLPTLTPAFLWSPLWTQVLRRDLLFSTGAGAGAAPAPTDSLEAHLLHAWQLWLTTGVDAGLAALAPLPGPAWLATSRMFGALGRGQDAMGVLVTRLSLAPDDVEALVGLGALQAQQKNFAGARQSLEGATQRAPGHARAWALLGRVQMDAGDTASAQGSWQRSLSLDPHQPDVHAWLRATQGGTFVPGVEAQ